ncbi:hypothetical protein [Demetria terragena]|uniref:hypothetical protein n=1 Tax=Demetria terragena TaxID=63959 RepID=UPI000364B5B5|nr:hypothetical protein [Demetria terragena]
MSIDVALDDLARTVATYGSGYLLTTTDGAVKVIAVSPVATEGSLRVHQPGPGTLANVGANATVTVIFPPTESPGLTLLVDGTAEVDGDDVHIVATHAILHRPAPAPPSTEAN